jgi:vacuolar-type H+-ATPase subunit I/STV1
LKLFSRLIFFLIALGVIFLALANRQIVSFSLNPFSPEDPSFGFRAPLFVLLMGAIGFGILLGYISSGVTSVMNGLTKNMNRIFSRAKDREDDD